MSGKIEISRELANRAIHCIEHGTETMGEATAIADELRIMLSASPNQYQRCSVLKECNTRSSSSTSAPVVERQLVRPVVWRIPVNGDWFYGTKEQCEREYAEYTADFTAEDFDEAGPVQPEPLACLDKVKELNQ